MPRPGDTPKAARTTGRRKFDNPLSRWLEERKARQKQTEEQAVRMISNKIEDNALKLIDELNSVDFLHSDLPESILNDRREEEVRPELCALEWDTRRLIQLIRNDRQNINMDIRSIDEKLMTLVLMFKQFVAHGDVMAAQMARDALLVGIEDIRCRLPVYQPELADAFIKEHTEYLAKWITLVGFAQNYDHTKNNRETELAATKDAHDKQDAKVNKIAQRIEKEPAFAEAFFYIQDHDSPTDRAKWTKSQREVHGLMVDAKLEDFNIMLHVLQSNAFESDLSVARQQMDSLRTCLNRLPNVSDPNLMNQYKEAMEQFVKDIAASDVRMEETLNTVDMLSGALDQLNESTGAVLAREAAGQTARNVLEKILKKQDDQSGQSEFDHARTLRERGFLTPEEREELKKQNEKKIAEANAQKIKAAQTQRPKQYN